MNRFFKFLMMFSLVVFALYACSKDNNKEEPKEPLPTPYIEFAAAEDANVIFTGGEAADKTVTLKANREVEATPSADWVTPTVTVNADKTVSLKISVKQSNATKKRTATISVTTKPAEEGDKTATPITISLSQGVFGLPIANLLDIVFTEGNGPKLAKDISPLANTVLDAQPRYADDGISYYCTKTYPTISKNTAYGRNSAYFTGSAQECNDKGGDNRSGSCAYRIDFVDYSTVQQHYFPKNPPNWDDVMNDNTQIPFTDLGKGLQGSYSIEAIFKLAPRLNGQANIIGWTQSYGASIGIYKRDGVDCLNWYLDTGPELICDACSDPITVDYKVSGETGAFTPVEEGRYYHVIGVYDKPGEKMIFYVDGVKSGERALQPGYVVRNAQHYKPDALAQWVCIGGDSRRADPYVNGQYIRMVDSGANWAEFVFTGEIVVARIYGKVLSDAEVKTLYDYEKPE
jgi:hypothetical protein